MLNSVNSDNTVPTDAMYKKAVDIRIKSIINENNKKKTLEHKTKVKQRYENIKQKYHNMKLKYDNIINSVTDYLNSDKCKSFTDDMKNVIFNHISTNIYEYDMIEESKYEMYTLFNYANISNKDTQKDERKLEYKHI